MEDRSHVDRLHDANVIHRDRVSDHMRNEINSKLTDEDVQTIIKIREKLDDHPDVTQNVF